MKLLPYGIQSRFVSALDCERVKELGHSDGVQLWLLLGQQDLGYGMAKVIHWAVVELDVERI
jgi:hypothetical protein